MISFFIVASIGMLLRFFILHEYSWDQLLITLMFPVATVVLWGIRIRTNHRDKVYLPKQSDNKWHTHMGERVSTGQKMIYLGQEKMATYHRYYPNLRQRFFTEVIDEGGHSDIHLSFRWLDGYDYTIEDNKKRHAESQPVMEPGFSRSKDCQHQNGLFHAAGP